MTPGSKFDTHATGNFSAGDDAYELMKDGYREMGIINTALSEEGFSEYAEYLNNYENLLAESE